MKSYFNKSIIFYLLGINLIIQNIVFASMSIRERNYLNCLGINGFAGAYNSNYLCQKFGSTVVYVNGIAQYTIKKNVDYSSTAHPLNPSISAIDRKMYGDAAEKKIFTRSEREVTCANDSSSELDKNNKKITGIDFNHTNWNTYTQIFNILDFDKTYYNDSYSVCESANIKKEMGLNVCRSFFAKFREAIYQQALLETGNFSSAKSLCLNNHTGLMYSSLYKRGIEVDKGKTDQGDVEVFGAFISLQDFFETYIRMIYSPIYRMSDAKLNKYQKLDRPYYKHFHGLCTLIADNHPTELLSNESMCAAVSNCQFDFQQNYQKFVVENINVPGRGWILSPTAPSCDHIIPVNQVAHEVVRRAMSNKYKVIAKDTLYGITRELLCNDYNSQNFKSQNECISQRIKEILKLNPQLPIDGTITEGQILTLPTK